ncbi:MAG: SWIM zinc finger family protein [Nanoarchaeota archaeon]
MMWNYFPKAAPRPKPVQGKERMKFGTTWWGKKWVEAVEGIGDQQRMSRGRAYARANRAFNIDIKEGNVTAKVEGSHGDYKVSMRFSKIDGDDKDRLLSSLVAQPELLGAILNNEVPDNLEDASKVDLIPTEFDSKCSCPDYENPCKHIAAVFYALAAEIDAAPQILLKIRGVDKNDILNVATGTLEAGIDHPSTVKKARKSKQSRPAKPTKKRPIKKAATSLKKPGKTRRE